MSNVEEEKELINFPKYTYRIRFTLPNGNEDVAFVHADHYEYDPVCVSFFEYCRTTGDPLVLSSIKNWFCIERKEYDEEDQHQNPLDKIRSAIKEFVDIYSDTEKGEN